MKRASVRRRRRDPSGRLLLNVVCPICDHRHWLPDGATGACTRRSGTFAIATTIHRSDTRS